MSATSQARIIADSRVDWITKTDIRGELADAGLASYASAVNHVERFCVAEVARRIAVPFAVKPTHWWDESVARYAKRLGDLELSQVTHYMPEFEKRFSEALGGVFKGMQGLVESKRIPQELAKIILEAAGPITRPLTGAELLDLIWGTRIIWPAEKIGIKPEEILLPWPTHKNQDGEIVKDHPLSGDDIWRRVLREHNIFTDENLKRASAWALTIGFPLFKGLPNEVRMDLVAGRLIHRSAISQNKKAAANASTAAPGGAPTASA